MRANAALASSTKFRCAGTGMS